MNMKHNQSDSPHLGPGRRRPFPRLLLGLATNATPGSCDLARKQGCAGRGRLDGGDGDLKTPKRFLIDKNIVKEGHL